MATERKGGKYIGVRYIFQDETGYGWVGCAVVQGPDQRQAEEFLKDLLDTGAEPFWPKYIRTKEEIDLGSIESDGGRIWYVDWVDDEAYAEALSDTDGDESEAWDLARQSGTVTVVDSISFDSRRAAQDYMDHHHDQWCPTTRHFVPYPWQEEMPKGRQPTRTMRRRKQPKKPTGAALIRQFLRGVR